jgi:hypothetical protein
MPNNSAYFSLDRMLLSEFSTRVRDALLQRFPEFEGHTRTSEDGSHIEIRFPHPSAPLELMITTDRDEISIFFDRTHRHIGMCQNLSIDEQISRARQFLAGLFSGAMPLVRDARWSHISFYDDPTTWGHDPEEKLTFMTWQTLTI